MPQPRKRMVRDITLGEYLRNRFGGALRSRDGVALYTNEDSFVLEGMPPGVERGHLILGACAYCAERGWRYTGVAGPEATDGVSTFRQSSGKQRIVSITQGTGSPDAIVTVMQPPIPLPTREEVRLQRANSGTA